MKTRNSLRLRMWPLAVMMLAAPVASAEVVMIVSSGSKLSPSVEQVCQVYLGKVKTPLAINLHDQDPVRDLFFSKACKKAPPQVRAIWGKLIFTGTGTPPKEVASAAEMKRAIAANPDSIGYIDKKDVDGSVKIIASAN